MKSYHNTTESLGQELDKYEAKAKNQDEKILQFMKTGGRPITPSAAWNWIFKGAVPLTSVRRAITNLTNDGHLVKTEAQVKGPYGRNEFVWRLADKHMQKDLF